MNEKLRAELSMLESKARSYESILRSPEQAGNGDWKNLLNEGHYLNQEGKKLMKINSKPCTFSIIKKLNLERAMTIRRR